MNNKLIYRRRQGDRNNIYLYDPWENTATFGPPVNAHSNLTEGFSGNHYNPTWRPGHEEFAFTSDHEGPGLWNIYTMVLGGKPRRLTSVDHKHPEPCYQPAWSPDGTKIAYVVGRGAIPDNFRPHMVDQVLTTIRVSDADGSHPWELRLPPESPGNHPTWAPDGGQIAYEKLGCIYVSDLLRSRRGQLGESRLLAAPYSSLSTHYSHPRWSRHGIVVRAMNDTLAYRIGVLSAVGSDFRTVAMYDTGSADETSEIFTDPTWRPDGRVTFARFTGQDDIRSARKTVMVGRGLWTVEVPATPADSPRVPAWACLPAWGSEPDAFSLGSPRWQVGPMRWGQVDGGWFEPDWQPDPRPTLLEGYQSVVNPESLFDTPVAHAP